MTQQGVYGAKDAVINAFRLLPRPERLKFVFVVIIQVFTALLDLIGVLLITAVGILAVQTAQATTNPLPGPLELVVTQLQSRGLDLKQITIAFAITAALFFVIKSLIAALLARRVLNFLANRQAQLSVNLIARLLNKSVVEIQHRSTLTTAYAAVQGATAAVVGILGSTATIVSESALLIVFAITLLIINPLVTIVATIYLGLVALIIYRALGSWSEHIGVTNAQTAIKGNIYVQDTLATFREISVLDRRGIYVSRIQDLLRRGSRAQADGALITQVPKYVFEAALIVGSVLLAGFLFLTSNLTQAFTTMVLFLAAGSRVLPSIMRLQGAIVTIRSSAGSSMETFRLAEQVADESPVAPDLRSLTELREELAALRDDFIPGLCFESVSFRYPGSQENALSAITIEVPPGRSLALVGSTGAGKSTLADVLLGTISPSEGSVTIGGLAPRDAIARWPGGIAYVPQHVSLVEGSVRDNVALGLTPDAVTDEDVWAALEQAYLADFLRDHREGLETPIGERGLRLSGGQRQRLGIARALFTRPKLLVLDEATSALDAQTEMLVAQVINTLHGSTTLVVIAHRLATIREFDRVAYLENGRLAQLGSFEDVRRAVRDFDEQASLLGL
jgi:ABC-type multidrug transport system fused ATPase/permease subunit